VIIETEKNVAKFNCRRLRSGIWFHIALSGNVHAIFSALAFTFFYALGFVPLRENSTLLRNTSQLWPSPFPKT
jgi:hypothetical protein